MQTLVFLLHGCCPGWLPPGGDPRPAESFPPRLVPALPRWGAEPWKAPIPAQPHCAAQVLCCLQFEGKTPTCQKGRPRLMACGGASGCDR